MNACLPHQPTDTEREAALAEFFATVRAAARESDAAVLAAKPALKRLAEAIVTRDNGQALRVRSILISLYTGGAVLADVSDLMTLDWSLRRDLCAVLLAFGHGEFGYDYMKIPNRQSPRSAIRRRSHRSCSALGRWPCHRSSHPARRGARAPAACSGSGLIDGTLPGKFWINLRTVDRGRFAVNPYHGYLDNRGLVAIAGRFTITWASLGGLQARR